MLRAEVEARHVGSAVGLVARDGNIVFLEAISEAAPGVPMFDDAVADYIPAFYGSSYGVLAAVIEAASGQTLEEFLHERLFRPLGMVDAYFWVPEEKRDRLAAVYRMRNGVLSLDRGRGEETPRSTFIAGGGGVRATVPGARGRSAGWAARAPNTGWIRSRGSSPSS